MSKLLPTDFLHLADYTRYSNLAVRKKFADTLVSLSDKAFLAILAPALGLALHQSLGSYLAFILLGALFFVAGLYFRHQALKVYDELLRSAERIGSEASKQL